MLGHLSKLVTGIAVAFIVLLGAGAVEATSVMWNFGVPTGGGIGSTHTYSSTPLGLPIVLSAFNTGSTSDPGFLYGKKDSGDETGVGVCQNLAGTNCGDHEIAVKEFIRVDLGSLVLSNIQFKLGSVQSGENYNIYTSASNAAFATGTPCVNHGMLDNTFFALNCGVGGIKEFLFVTAGAHDVLLGAIQAEAPEPITMFLGGTGLLLLGYAARRRLFDR
jgi:hypothetical protein